MPPLSVPAPVALGALPPVDEPEVEPPGASDVLPDVDAPPALLPSVVPAPAGDVEGAAPGVFVVSDGGVEAAGVEELGGLLVPPVVPCSLLPTPPRLHAVRLRVSRIKGMNDRDAYSLRFIECPFFGVSLTECR